MATAIGAVGLGTSVAGGVLSAFGAKQSAVASAAQYNYQAQVAKINSDIDKQNADFARSAGDQQAIAYGMKAAQQGAQIKVQQAASGLDVNSGSNVEVQQSQKKITQMDTNTIRANAAKTAYGFDVQSEQDVNQAGLYSMAASNAKATGNINALGSLIGTASSVSSKWLQGDQAGLWNGSSSGGGWMGTAGGTTGGLGGLY